MAAIVAVFSRHQTVDLYRENVPSDHDNDAHSIMLPFQSSIS